ncbi:hypothetical protein [Nocardia sp. NPDC050435]|uniref:hypothetical protein n=1 Tax=Nocardia sp. NPDC050435 TaxID=3155040 RepID=UPI0033D00290
MTRRLGPVDMIGLTIVAEHYGIRMDDLAEMFAISRRSAYRRAQRWREAGMVAAIGVRPVPGPTWVFIRKSAAEALLGFPVHSWAPTPKMADHVRTVLRVRLALVGMDLDRWVSERVLRSEVGRVKAGESRPHIHDGRWLDSEGRWWAVEVELTAKNLAAAKTAVYKAAHTAKAAELDGLIYYCRTEWINTDGTTRRSDQIHTVVREAAGYAMDQIDGLSFRVAKLEEVLTTNNKDENAHARPGLRVIEGGASDHGNQDGTRGDTGKAASS